MANLIITVIAIALVAVASLMGAYYGGSAFLNNTSAAGASTVMNEGQQIAGAWQSFLSDNYNQPPDNTGCLTGGTNSVCGPNGGNGPQYLANIPNYPVPANNANGAGQIVIVSYNDGVHGTHYYALADVGTPGATGAFTTADPYAAACYKIIKVANGFTGAIGAGSPYQIAAGGAGNGTFGCSGLVAAVAGTPLTNSPSPAGMDGHYVMAYKLS